MWFNPYPGLRSFEYKEYELFFGREGQAEEVMRRLQKSHFLAVVGTSGSGKSSLVKAGLLPLLYSGLMFSAGAQWRVAMFRPGNNPIYNLARALVYPPDFVPRTPQAETNPLDINDEMKVGVVETILRRSAVGLVDHVKASNLATQENLLIVIDQFEELFRFKEHTAVEAGKDSAETEDKAAFVKLLLNAVHDKSISNIYIVITMRSDYLGDCAQFRDLPETINDGQYLIPRMTRDQLREAIEEPATMTEEPAKISELLVNRLLNDIGDNQDQLPILQHALMRTWKVWEDDGKPSEISVEHYERVGGMAKALSLHADKALNELSEDKKIIAEKMFRCLTSIDAGNRETRRETELGEICRIFDADISEVIPVIEAFRREGRTFLMPPPDVPLDANCVIDISHESLIRNWEKLNKWVADEAKWASLYRRLADDAQRHLNKEVNYWVDPALQIALDWRENFKPNAAWAERYHPAFDEAMEFLKASEAARAIQIAKDKTQVKRLRWLVAGLGLMFLLSSGLALTSFYLYREAIASAEQAITSAKKALSSENATRTAKEIIYKQNEDLDIKNKKLDESFKNLASEKGKTDKINFKLSEKEIALKAALKKAQDSEEAQKRSTDKAQKARKEAEQSAETARQAEETAKGALEKAEQAARTAELAEVETQKNLKREREIRAASTMIERGIYLPAIELFNSLASEYESSSLPDKQTGQWWMVHNLGTAQWKDGQLEKAHQTYIKALEVLGETIKDDPYTTTSEQTSPIQLKSPFIKTAFQPQEEDITEKDLSKMATYRKLGQVNLERALSGFGDDLLYYRWAKLGYKKFFGIYNRTTQDKESQFAMEATNELGDVYVALDEFNNAKTQFTIILDKYKRDLNKFALNKSEGSFDGLIGVKMWIKLSEIELNRGKYEAASEKIKEGIDLLGQAGFENDALVAELYDARAKIYLQRSEREKNDTLKVKFANLASEYSAVATGIRNLKALRKN